MAPDLSPDGVPLAQARKQESFLPGLILNIVLPVMILNKLGKWIPTINPWWTLAIALAFPIASAIWGFISQRKVGALSALGALNVIGTGGLAALGLGGIWFAVKEAFFPLVIGVGVLVSAFTRSPAAGALFFSEAIFNVDKIRSHLTAVGRDAEFKQSLKVVTFAIAGSFFLSAVLNFVLALYVFTPLAPTLTEIERSQLLNEQVARMTWMGFAVIALPSFLCTAAAFWILVKSLRRLTGLEDSELFAA